MAAGSTVTAVMKKHVPTVRKSYDSYHEKLSQLSGKAVTAIMKKLSQLSRKVMTAIMKKLSQLSGKTVCFGQKPMMLDG